MNQNIKGTTVIIPAYKPSHHLISTVKGLSEIGFDDILVVDDGGGEEFRGIFEEVERVTGCMVLHHHVNRGKGRALKTAITYFLENREGQRGVVTADADGQHLVEDIAAVSRSMMETGKVILGVRDFDNPIVPARSKAGNKITSAVFRIFFGMRLSDTQTGLRAFPREYLSDILEANGERYEFETDMLILMNRKKIPMGETVINTVYIEDNNSSHFNPIKDSIKIYALILKYISSSFIGALTDEFVFYLCKRFAIFAFIPVPLTFSSAFIARAVSSFVNYQLNANMVFKDAPSKKSFFKYYALVILQITLSTVIVFSVENIFSIESALVSTIVKTIIDTLLFFLSFRIQHRWVFNNNKRKERNSSK